VPEPVVVLAATGREVRDHRVRHPVERDPLHDAGQAEAVVTVEVGDADPGQAAHRDAGDHQLALGALAGIEEDRLGVPAQQVTVLVAAAGRYLTGGAEDGQLAHAVLRT
jgi:hypothetical protein